MLLPTITTITPGAWRKKIKEIKKLKLKEVALFPTCLNPQERQELYSLLKKTDVKRVPFVHLKTEDMPLAELDYLKKNFNVQVFNTHTQKEYAFCEDYQKYHHIIYIENTYAPLDEEEIKEFGGICLDFSHLENDRLQEPEKYKHNVKIIEKYLPGCCHISAVKKELKRDSDSQFKFSSHHLSNLSELDYLKNYPLKYFAPYISIELENTIEEQLEGIKYIKKILQGGRK